MSAKRKSVSKKSCQAALSAAERELMKLPKVVGVGVVRNNKGRGHRVAIYVSKMPKTNRDANALPQKLNVPESDQEVETEVLEIGEIKPESTGSGDGPVLGKEPL